MFTLRTHLKEAALHNPLVEKGIARYQPEIPNWNTTLEEFCQYHMVDQDFLLVFLNTYANTEEPFDARQFERFSVPVILDCLHKTHAYYINRRLFEIEQTIVNMLSRFDESKILLKVLLDFFKKYEDELVEHIEDEEVFLFPYIIDLVRFYEEGESAETLEVLTNTQYRLDHFKARHDDHIGQQIGQIGQLIGDFIPNFEKELSFQILMTQIEAFERDLYVHDRLEEEVLLPMATIMEDAFFGKGQKSYAAEDEENPE